MEIYSILTKDLNHCFVCGRPEPQMHHAMNKADKKKAEIFGLMLPLCEKHHTGAEGVHTDPERMKACRRMAQREFEKIHGHEEWMKQFGKDYTCSN